MLDEIKNSDLVITPNYIKKRILKEASKTKKIIDFKCLTLEELKKTLFETYDEKALYYLMKNYDLNYDLAKEYLDNIFLDYKDIKIYYNKLKEEKLLIKKNFNYKNITVIDYENIEPYILQKLNNYNVKFIKKESQKHIHNIYEFETRTDEIVYAATKITKDLKKVDINDIYLVIPNDEYIIEVERIFKLFNIPIDIEDKQSIYSTKTAQTFLANLKKLKDINKALESTPKNEIYNYIIDILNKYTFIKEVDNTYIDIITKEIKNKKIKKEQIDGAVKVINFDQIGDEDKYYYILGLNQNIIPKIHDEKGIINEKAKQKLGLFNTSDKNKIEKEKVIKILINYPNIYASYKLKDNQNSYYPSSIISDLNLEIIKPEINLNYSNMYNKLLLGSLLDKYINYNEEDQRIEKLYSTYKDIDYKTYDNEYETIDNEKIKKYLNNKLTLSYSSMNNYFLCPFKFYIQNILKLNKKEDTFPILVGNLFHHVLQNLYTESFDIDTCYAEYLKDKALSPKEKHFLNKLKDVLKEDIKVIKMQDNHTKFQTKLTEKKIIIEKEKNINFMGVIDKISMLDDYIIITDYKTGNVQTTLDNITDGLNMQLPVYIYLKKNGLEKDKKIVGFYLQKLLNNIQIDSNEDEKDNLKLNGYTINDEKIIEKIDDTYEDSQLIKSMKKTKNGFYSYTKLISEKEIDLIEKITNDNIDKVINAVKNSDFKINPKRLKDKLISCEFCEFKDLCFYKEEDITTLKQKTFEEIVGDSNA